jgi:tyrosyl-tRNA synthetase
VHGQEGLDAAERITIALFEGTLSALSESDVLQLRQDGLPASVIARADFPETLTQMLTDAGMVASGKQVKDALARNAVTANNRVLGLQDNGELARCFAPVDAVFGRFSLVRLGKKKYHLFEIS